MRTRHDTAVSSPTPAEALGPVVTAIDHVGFAVRDLDESIAFYGRTFGLPLVHREVNEEQGVEEAMVGIGDSAIQLLAALRPDSAIGRFLERNGEVSSRSRSASPTSTSRPSACATPACACSTTPRAAAPQARGSTSCTPRTAAASWSSSSSPPPTRSDRM